MELNSMRNKGINMDEYFRSNQNIVSDFLEEQFRTFELQQAGSAIEDSGNLLMSLMELNKEVVLKALEAQKYGVTLMSKAESSITVPVTGSFTKDPALEHLLPVQQLEQEAEVRYYNQNIDLEQWMKDELAQITGFSSQQIVGTMKFEEDLGLVSINMIELFARFVDQFPHLNRDISDIIEAKTIEDFIHIMTNSEKKQEEISHEVLLKWMKREISGITGFPVENITGSMKFEEDLGLVSINMIEIFSHLVEEFPELNGDIEEVIGAASISELIEMILIHQQKKKEPNEAGVVESLVTEIQESLTLDPAAPVDESPLFDPEEAIVPEIHSEYKAAEEAYPADEQVCGRVKGESEVEPKIVAVVRLFSDPTTLEENRILGISIDRGRHSFLSIQNVSSHPLLVGKLILAAGKTISLGTLSHGKTKEYGGLWYGLEARNIAVRHIYGPRASIRCDITQQNLDVINSLLPQFYSGWSYLRNCAFFASTIWNSISTVKITGRSPLTAKIVYDGIIDSRMQSYAVPVPHHYAVYHASGDGLPIKSVCWN